MPEVLCPTSNSQYITTSTIGHAEHGLLYIYTKWYITYMTRKRNISISSVMIEAIRTPRGMSSKYTVMSLFLAKQTTGGNLVSSGLYPPNPMVNMEGKRSEIMPASTEAKCRPCFFHFFSCSRLKYMGE